MARKDIVMATQEELRCLHIVQKVLEGGLKQVEAAEVLLLSDRQVRRIIKRVRVEGSYINLGVCLQAGDFPER